MKIILKLLAVILVTLPLKINAGRDENSSQSSGNDSYTTTLTKLKDKENQFEFDSGSELSLLERDPKRNSSFYRLDRTSVDFDQGGELDFYERFTSVRYEIDEETCINEMLAQDKNATYLVNMEDNNDGRQLVIHKFTDRTTWGLELPVKMAK